LIPRSASAHVHPLALDADFDGSLTGAALTDAIGASGNTVAAIAT
jgi:hypothetical protein